MYKHGFLKVAAATPKIIAGDIINNRDEILNTLEKTNASITVFPELTLTGYSMSDLFFQTKTIDESLASLKYILHNNNYEGVFTIGMPLSINDVLFNVAVVIFNNKILGIIPKYYLPNNYEYNEKRWFESGYNINIKEVELFDEKIPFGKLIFKDKSKNINIGVEICQDMWQLNPPSNDLVKSGANVILNLSASSELVLKDEVRRRVVLENTRRQMSSYVYTTTGIYESSSEHLFSSHKMIASLGSILKEENKINYDSSLIEADININEINFKRRQDSNYRTSIYKDNDEVKIVEFNLPETNEYKLEDGFNKAPFLLSDTNLNKTYEILTASLVKKILSMPENNRNIILGLSGGLDSLHALLIAYEAVNKLNLPLTNLKPIIMPAEASSKDSMEDAISLCNKLNLTCEVINIDEEVKLHMKMINHKEKDTTYENVQARIRTLILMNLANKYKGFVLGTGDLSEIALGFMTYNGDQMSMYAINSGLPKTSIRQLVNYYGENKYKNIKQLLNKIVDKKVSPELLKNQVTEDIIGLYEINDFILYNHLHSGLEKEELKWLLKEVYELSNEESNQYVDRFFNRFYSQTFKRQTMPEGPKIFDISLSPRTSFKQPSDIVRK